MIRSALAATTLLLALTAALPASDAAASCLPKGSTLVCGHLEGGCVSVISSPGPDAGIGAAECTEVSASGACQSAGAAYGTIAGPRGAYAEACVRAEDGTVCAYPFAQVNDEPTTLNPLCLA